MHQSGFCRKDEEGEVWQKNVDSRGREVKGHAAKHFILCLLAVCAKILIFGFPPTPKISSSLPTISHWLGNNSPFLLPPPSPHIIYPQAHNKLSYFSVVWELPWCVVSVLQLE